MEIQATAKNIRISPQKVRLVVKEIKKMKPKEAVEVLDFIPKKSSVVLKKVINSAIANAKNNHGIAEELLKFQEIQVGPGPMFKRYRPISRGRAHSILKRTSHVRVVLKTEDSKTQLKPAEPEKEIEATKTEKQAPKSKKEENGTKG